MARTSGAEVKKVFNTVLTEIQLDAAQVPQAHNMLNSAIAQSSALGALGDPLLTDIETYLAAHFGTTFDPVASESVRSKSEDKYKITSFLSMVYLLDTTKTLENLINSKRKASLSRLGTI